MDSLRIVRCGSRGFARFYANNAGFLVDGDAAAMIPYPSIKGMILSCLLGW